MKKLLSRSANVISVFLWLPSQVKLLRTHSAKDYNPWSFALILWLQVSCWLVARMDGSKNLQTYYLINGLNVAFMLLLILAFR